MSPTVVLTIVTLTLLGMLSAVILFIIARKFMVFEDPRIDLVQEVLPAANCGGCGFAGCRNFAEALVSAESFEGLNCPVGGSSTMEKAASILGRTALASDPLVAVLLCNGSHAFKPRTSSYSGPADCKITHTLYSGESDCGYGCLGNGDCVRACTFGAMHMDEVSGLPVIDDAKCVACGLCVKACPRKIIELRKKAKKDSKLYVACSSHDKGAVSRKACQVSCIACNKCFKVCEFGAITIENNLAYIDASKCTFCRKCVGECPTSAILEFNFPARKAKPVMEETESNA